MVGFHTTLRVGGIKVTNFFQSRSRSTVRNVPRVSTEIDTKAYHPTDHDDQYLSVDGDNAQTAVHDGAHRATALRVDRFRLHIPFYILVVSTSQCYHIFKNIT